MLTLIPVLLSVSLAADPKLEPPLPEGHRAYAVKFEPATQIDGFIQPGIKVDVVLTEKEKEGKAKSSVVLKDVLVVVVDMAVKGKVLTATLAVKPDDAKTLADAEKKGKLSLVLKPIGDKPKGEKP